MNDPIKRVRKPPNFDEVAFLIFLSKIYAHSEIHEPNKKAAILEQTYNLRDDDAKLE